MASIEININNKNYKSSSNNKNIVKTSTLKENSSNIEEVNLDDENQNVEEIETDNIDINNSEEEYNMTSSQTKDMIEKLESARDNYVKNYKELEEKYTDISNKEWYENGVLTANPTTNLPYTPEEYKSFLMRNGNITEEELKENEELTHQLDTYTKTYNEQFKKVVGVGYSEYKELKESYKSDLTILDNTISSLNSLAIEENYNEVLNTDSYKTYISSKKDMSFSELEQNYNEYNSKSIEITESAEASSKLYDTYNPMYIIEYAEQLAESEKFDITDVLEKQVQSYQYDLSEFYEYYKVMSEEEKNLYSYYFETEGREAAEKYFNDMKDTWNKKIAYNRFQEDVSSLDLTDEGAVKTNIANTLNVNIDGIGDGINQFMSGIANSITNNKEITIEEYKTMYYLAYLEQNSKILSTSYKVGTATGNMIPSITASTLTAIIAPEIAPKVGQTLIGISAFGNTKHSALIEGYSIPTSILYGVMSGGSEMLFESVGGIIGIADNPGGNALLRLLKEGAEEGAQSYIQAGIDAVILGKEINLDEITDDAKESFLIGVLVAAESNVYSKGLTDSISFIQNGERITLSSNEVKDMLENILKKKNSVDNSETNLISDEIKTFIVDEDNKEWYADKEIKQKILNLDPKSLSDFVNENRELIYDFNFSSLSKENKFQYYIFLDQLVSKFGTKNSLRENIWNIQEINTFFPQYKDVTYNEKISNLEEELNTNYTEVNNEVIEKLSGIFGDEIINNGLYFPIYTKKDTNGTYKIIYKIGNKEYSRYIDFSTVSEFNNFIKDNRTDIMNNNFEVVSSEKIDLNSKYNINSEGIYTIYYLENGVKKKTKYYSFKNPDNTFNFPTASEIAKLLGYKNIEITNIKKDYQQGNFSKINSLLSSQNKEKYIEDIFYNYYINNMNESPEKMQKDLNNMIEELKKYDYDNFNISLILKDANANAINENGIFETYISDLRLKIKMQKGVNLNISDELTELRSLPKEIQKLVDGKTFTYLKTPNPSDCYSAERYGIDNFVSAADTIGDGSMTFYNGKGTTNYKGTMTHEIGHTFDKVYSNKIDNTSERISTSKIWKDAMQTDEKLTNDTAVTNYPRSVKDENSRAIEDFAESFMLYYTNPNELKKYPNRYKVLEEILPKD